MKPILQNNNKILFGYLGSPVMFYHLFKGI